MARPRKELDRKEFEGLLALQCTLSEVTAFFDHTLNGCSEDTVERWCKREYGESFAEVSVKKREYGKIGLRRSAFELAKKSAAMNIFLCKNLLGMTDRCEIDTASNGRLEELINGLKEQPYDLYAKAAPNDGAMAHESTATD